MKNIVFKCTKIFKKHWKSKEKWDSDKSFLIAFNFHGDIFKVKWKPGRQCVYGKNAPIFVCFSRWKIFCSFRIYVVHNFCFYFEMKLKRAFSTKRCLLFWACLVGLTVLFQNAIVILVSICSKGSCCLKLGEVESYPSRKFGKCYVYHCYHFAVWSQCNIS